VIVFFADVEFATDYWLDARSFGGVDEVDRAEDVSVVGHGHGGHAHFLDAVAELFYVAGAVEHGVVGMQVEMDELGHRGIGDCQLPIVD
jgi:hypothetical protein